MYIKWIVCHVKDDKRHEFSIAQEKWRKTDIAKGFIAQTGGWNSKNKNIACIISFWKNKNHLENFMKNTHDNIFHENKQVDTYNSIFVQYFSNLFNTKTNMLPFKNTIQNSKLLNVIDCYMKVGKEYHFEENQKEMLSKSPSNTSHYFISTFWDNLENHTNYINNKPNKADVKKITKKQILLVDSWKVIGKT